MLASKIVRSTVIHLVTAPAQAGVQKASAHLWIPVFTGMKLMNTAD